MYEFPGNPMEDKVKLWVDCEVHLLPPECCEADYRPPADEEVLIRVLYEHPERDKALFKATAEGLLTEMDRAGIEKAVVMGLPWRNPGLCWKNNEYISEVVREYPHRFVGIGVLPPPELENPVDGVRRLADEFGLRGVKTIPSWQGFRLNDRVFEPALKELTDRSMILVPHTDHLFIPPDKADTAYSLYEAARRFPELKIIAPHLGGLLCLYNLHPPVRPALKNIMFVTSVPATMKMIEFAVQAAGVENVAFGTDFPFNPTHDQLSLRKSLEELSFSEAEEAMIAGGNILRFLGDDI